MDSGWWPRSSLPRRAGTEGGWTIPALPSPFPAEHTVVGWAQMQEQVNRPGGPSDHEGTADLDENGIPY